MIGAATAVLALLALAAMHGLPVMGVAMPAADVGVMSAVDAAGAPTMTHTPGDPMAAMGHDAAAHLAAVVDAEGALAAASGHDAGGVPLHGHSFVHLCLAVLVAALTFVLGRWLRPRLLTVAPQVRAIAQRPLFSLDIGPPSRVALCVVRC